RTVPRALQPRLARAARGDDRQRGSRRTARRCRAGVPRGAAAPAARPRSEVEPRARGAAAARRLEQPEQPTLRGEWRSPERRWRRLEPRARAGRRRRAGRHESGAGGSSVALDRPAGAQDATGPHRPDAPRRGARREGLVMLTLWVLAALQSGPAPDVTARVDRTHLTAGDNLLLTIRARTRSASPVTLALPALTGFTVVGSRDVTEVTLEALGGPVRTTTRELEEVAVTCFPRDQLGRLRRAPILTLQTPEGFWSYPGAAPSEVAASRLVRGRWLDLFVAHEAVFPLTPGRILIPPATVEYAVPASFSFFSREDRYSLRSDTVPVQVLPLPGAPATAGDPPAVARGLSLDLRLDPPNGRVGEPIPVTATLSPRPLIVAAGLEPRPPRALPPLEHRGGPVWTDELAHDLVPWGWLVLCVGPPLLAWLWTRRRPAEPIRVAAPAPAPLSRIGRA